MQIQPINFLNLNIKRIQNNNFATAQNANKDTNLNFMPQYRPIAFGRAFSIAAKVCSETQIAKTNDLIDFLIEKNIIPKENGENIIKKSRMRKNLPLPINKDYLESNMQKMIKYLKGNDIAVEKYLKRSIKDTRYLYRSFESIKTNVDNFVPAFKPEELTETQYLNAMLKHFDFTENLGILTSKAIKNFVLRFQNDGLTNKNFLKIALNNPKIFFQDIDITSEIIRNGAKKSGVTTNEYIKLALKNPSMFLEKIESGEKFREIKEKTELIRTSRIRKSAKSKDKTVNKKITGIAEIAVKEQNKKKPEKSTRIVNRVNTIDIGNSYFLVRHVKTQTEFIQMLALKEFIDKETASLLLEKCKKNIRLKNVLETDFALENVKNIKTYLKQYNLKIENYLNSGIEFPYLLSQPSAKIKFFTEDFAKRFTKEGLSEKDVLSLLLKYPYIMKTSPEKIETNIKEIVNAYKKDGLTTEKYIKSALTCPQLFLKKLNLVEENINSKLNFSNGISRQKSMDIMLQNPEMIVLKSTLDDYSEILAKQSIKE